MAAARARIPTRRRDAEATRQRLMAAGRQAFARKGLAGAVLTDDILRPAGVSAGSFYHQFQDKADLLLAILEAHSASLRDALTARLTPGPGRSFEDLVRDAAGHVLDMADREGDLLTIHARERDGSDPRVARALRRNHQRWIDDLTRLFERLAPTIAPGLDARLTAELIISLGLGAVTEYQLLSPRQRAAKRDRLVEGLVCFAAGGIRALAPLQENP